MNNRINIQQEYNSAEARFSGFDGLGEIDVFEPLFTEEKKSKKIAITVTNNDVSSRTALLFGFSKYINSTNLGNGNDITTWSTSGSGITTANVFSFASNSAGIFVGGGAPDEVWLSTNNGLTWTVKNTGITGPQRVDVLFATGSYVFAGKATSGLFRTADNGDNWTVKNDGLTNTDITSFAVIGNNLFVGTLGGVFKSTDNGDNWTAASTGLTNTDVYALAAIGTTLFAGTLGGVFRSTDNGANWTAVNTGITDLNIGTLYTDGTNLWAGNYAGGTVGIFLSTNNGDSWTVKNTGITNYWVEAFTKNGNTIYAATVGAGIFQSTDTGATWTAINSGLTDLDVYDLLIVGTRFFAATAGGKVNINDFVNLTNTASVGNITYAEILSASALNPFTMKSVTIRTTDASDASLPETITYQHTDPDGRIRTNTFFTDDFLNEYDRKPGKVTIPIKKKLMPMQYCRFQLILGKNSSLLSKQLTKVWLQYQMKNCNPKFMPEA